MELIEFYAEWCGPCRVFGPIIERVSQDLGLPLMRIDVDKNPDKARQFGVMSVPTTILFDNGREIGRVVGAVNEQWLRNWILSSVKRAKA